MNARRKKLQMAVVAEKMKNAAGATSAEVQNAAVSGIGIVYSKHFMIEPQTTEDGETDEYAVYRVIQLLTATDAGETVEPVHVFELAVDAAHFVLLADAMIEKEDPESTPVPVIATAVEPGPEPTTPAAVAN